MSGHNKNVRSVPLYVTLGIGLLAWSGCGRPQEIPQARDAARQALTYFVQGQGEQLCAALDQPAQQQLLSASQELTGTSGSCPQQTRRLLREVLRRTGWRAEQIRLQESIRLGLGPAEQHGDRVILHGKPPSSDQVEMVRKGDRWLVHRVDFVLN